MFSTFNSENNPIIEPIDEMSKQIFKVENPPKETYKKVDYKK